MISFQTPYVLDRERTAGSVDFHDAPFRYFLSERCLAPSTENDLLGWFETDASWHLVETDFYAQYECSMFYAALPQNLCQLISKKNLFVLRRSMEAIFDTSLSDRVSLVAHKLVSSHRIGIHNDYLGGDESHRLTIQVNRGFNDDDGGLFLIFNSVDPSDIHRILRPISGSGIGFEIGVNSNHAVSRVHCGERYTLVYTFYA